MMRVIKKVDNDTNLWLITRVGIHNYIHSFIHNMTHVFRRLFSFSNQPIFLRYFIKNKLGYGLALLFDCNQSIKLSFLCHWFSHFGDYHDHLTTIPVQFCMKRERS